MKPGIYVDLSNEQYHNHKESISRSALMDFAISPYTYWAKHLNPNRPKKEPTTQMQLGSAFHTYCLEPSKFWEIYNVELEHFTLKHLTELFGKEKAKHLFNEQKITESLIEKENKIIITHKEYHAMKNMLDKITCNDYAIKLLTNARIENSFFWVDEDSGLLLKARPDILHENMIVDLKTCADASPRGFQRAMVEGGNHIQGAMIRDAVEKLEGRRINTVINICIENKYPHNMGIYIIDEEAIDAGHMKYKQLCLDMKEAFISNTFTDYGVQQIGLPKWAI